MKTEIAPELWIGYGYEPEEIEGVKRVLRGELTLAYSHFAEKPKLHVFGYKPYRIPHTIMAELASILGWPQRSGMSEEIVSPDGAAFGTHYATAPTREAATKALPLVCDALKTIGAKYIFVTKAGIEKGEVVRFEP